MANFDTTFIPAKMSWTITIANMGMNVSAILAILSLLFLPSPIPLQAEEEKKPNQQFIHASCTLHSNKTHMQVFLYRRRRTPNEIRERYLVGPRISSHCLDLIEAAVPKRRIRFPSYDTCDHAWISIFSCFASCQLPPQVAFHIIKWSKTKCYINSIKIGLRVFLLSFFFPTFQSWVWVTISDFVTA